MNQAFCVSDIHGCYDEFVALLKHWDAENEQLILMGDYIDRGTKSKEVMAHIQQLCHTYKEQVIVLKGNHDAMLGEFVGNPRGTLAERFLRNGGQQTLASFIGEQVPHLSREEQANYMATHYSKELAFLQSLPLYYEWGKVLFTHAGFQSKYTTWQESTEEHFLWIRQHYGKENGSGLRNVFGHTPTARIRSEEEKHGYHEEHHGIWISNDGKYIGIDGGCVFGGQLNGLRIKKDGRIVGIIQEAKQ